MKTSPSITTIAAVLPKAQAEIKGALKDATNPHFRSKYADLTSVIEACKAALNKHGITFLQPVRSGEDGVIVETVLLHTSGEWISDELELPVSKNDAQGVGSAITYGRRYGLQSMVGIPAEDDDGNAAAKSPADRVLARPTDAKQEAVDALARMDIADQQFIRDSAIIVIDAHENGKAYEVLDGLNFDNEQKLAIWSLLPSNVRTAIKKAKANGELATQP
jgi:hypothetical protein